jgi:hypothetical protein
MEDRNADSTILEKLTAYRCRLTALAPCLFLAGCLAPSASESVDLAQEVSGARVVACAERTVSDLARSDDRWDPRVTLRDSANGVMESGNFSEENESGFRVRVEMHVRRRQVDVDLKGAGAYFVDMGVAEAIDAFSQRLMPCLQRPDG